MITISLCMIVKNEESVLARCLDSVVDLVDEIIIVDTGSTDATRQIATKYTDKIYDFEWIDDFSAARNYSVSKATMEYIYIADADEVIEEENRQRFLEVKQALLPEVDVVQMQYANQLEYGTTYNFDVEFRPKLYKRLRPICFIDPIHETVKLEAMVYDSDIVIQHKPLHSHAKRDFTIFQKVINKGVQISKKLHNMYARELYIAGNDNDFLSAYPFFLGSMEDEARGLEEVREAACIVARVARIQKDLPVLFKFCLKNVATSPCSEMCFELGEYFYGIEDYKEAVIWYYNAAYEAESLLNIHYTGKYPLRRLADCYDKLGNQEQAGCYRELADNVSQGMI